MRNFKEETMYELAEHGKLPKDIRWVGCPEFVIPVDLFWELANRDYDSGYGGQEVASDLLVVGDDWWMERHEYDGSEWWEFKTFPTMPTILKPVSTLFTGGWTSLRECAEVEDGT